MRYWRCTLSISRAWLDPIRIHRDTFHCAHAHTSTYWKHVKIWPRNDDVCQKGISSCIIGSLQPPIPMAGSLSLTFTYACTAVSSEGISKFLKCFPATRRANSFGANSKSFCDTFGPPAKAPCNRDIRSCQSHLHTTEASITLRPHIFLEWFACDVGWISNK